MGGGVLVFRTGRNPPVAWNPHRTAPDVTLAKLTGRVIEVDFLSGFGFVVVAAPRPLPAAVAPIVAPVWIQVLER
jgi:hypothetical protein